MPPPSSRVQLTDDGKLRHFLTTEHLPRPPLEDILDTAASFVDAGGRSIAFGAAAARQDRGESVLRIEYRTGSTFELAAQRLSADVLNLDIAVGDQQGRNPARYPAQSGHGRRHVRSAPPGFRRTVFIANEVTPNVAVINAGDGRHAHPTQAMLDMYTIRHYKGGFAGLKVAIVGDIPHSRVARSQVHALNALGAEEVRLIGPKTLLPVDAEALGATVSTDMAQGLKEVDVVIMLRLQKERMDLPCCPVKGNSSGCTGSTTTNCNSPKRTPDASGPHQPGGNRVRGG